MERECDFTYRLDVEKEMKGKERQLAIMFDGSISTDRQISVALVLTLHPSRLSRETDEFKLLAQL